MVFVYNFRLNWNSRKMFYIQIFQEFFKQNKQFKCKTFRVIFQLINNAILYVIKSVEN